ncbi:MAG: hypothetical protein IPL35_17230 [Sphingobacteriales bacterium]|nr:hypothetical protein [Sphingobacteriales bacterium]
MMMMSPPLDAAEHNTAEQLYREALFALLRHEPFFGEWLIGIRHEFTAVAAAELHFYEQQQAAFLLRLHLPTWLHITPEQRSGLLKHQLVHIALQHPFRAVHFADTFIFNLAADLVANQYLNSSQLLPSAFTLASVTQIGLPPFQSIDFYYNELQKYRHLLPPAALYVQAAAQHTDWQLQQTTLAAATQWQTQQYLQRHITVYQKNYGKLPAGVERWQSELQQMALVTPVTAPVNWKKMLQHFVWQSGLHSTLHTNNQRLSKRYGTAPALQVRSQQKLAVAIDTSASIGSEEFNVFWGALQQLWRQYGDFYLLEFDAIVQRCSLYKGKKPLSLKGGGGTSFDPLLQYANEHLHTRALLIFTDGIAPPPQWHSRAALYWLISAQGIQPHSEAWHYLKGRKASLNDNSEK